MTCAPPPASRVTVLMPVFNDWKSASRLVEELGRISRERVLGLSALLVDDGSTEQPTESDLETIQRSGLDVTVLPLKLNLGHQRALGVGICFACQNIAGESLVVMDCDGEDDPEDVPRLIDAARASGGSCVVFAERRRRVESAIFKVGYYGYRLLHRLLTGVSVRFGNFSVIPRTLLERIAMNPGLWNHYSASVVFSRIPVLSIPTRRARRYAGSSKMNLVSLVTHGLSAISVFGERVVTRLLVMLAICVGVAVAGLLAVLAIRVGTDLATPGWATSATGLIALLLMQLLVLAGVSVLALLRERHSAPTIPLRDFPILVKDCARYPAGRP